MKELKGGLLPLQEGKKHFQLGQLVQYPKLSDLPEEFDIVPDDEIVIMDQIADGNDDMCSAYATCGMSALQEGTQLWPQFSFAASKKLSGDPGEWGQTIDKALESHVEIGALAIDDVPKEDMILEGKDKRYFEKYSEMGKTRAIIHQKDKYYFTKGPYDAYDNIRSALFMFAKEKRAVIIGVKFGWSLDSFILSGTPDGFPHSMYVKGWDKIGLKIVQSAGKNAGINGFHRMTRDTIEAYAKTWGAGMFIDLTSEEVQKRLIKKQIGLLQWVYQLLLSLFAKKVMEQPKEVFNESIQPEYPNDPPVEVYDWSDPEKARHSVRVICDEEGLTVAQKNTLCETVKCESGFNPLAKHENKNAKGVITSTDWGICQINDYWHIGPNKSFPSVEYVLNNPEACIRWMCTMWKANKQMLWVCYKKLYG